MEVKIYEDEPTIIEAYTNYIISCAKLAIGKKGRFHLVLSGGNSPKRVFELLSSETYLDAIDWKKTFVFFSDERFVPYEHPRNNGSMVLKTLFQNHLLPDNHFYRIETDETPEKNAQAYMETLRKHFFPHPIHFDLVLLGLGDNVHTASLFPHQSILLDIEKDVKSFYLEEEKTHRITMTAPLLNDTDKIAFLVYGETKAIAVKHALEGTENLDLYPAQLINRDKSTWFLDIKAAEHLSLFFS